MTLNLHVPTSLCATRILAATTAAIRLDIEEAMEVCRPGSDQFEQVRSAIREVKWHTAGESDVL